MLFDVAGEPRSAIGRWATLVQRDGQTAVCIAGSPVYVYDSNDKAAESACIAMLSRADVASDVEIARAFGRHRNTVARLATRLRVGGMSAVVPAAPGPKGPHKVTPEVLSVIAAHHELLSAPALGRLVAEQAGVALSPTHIRRLVHSLRPTQTALFASDDPVAAPEQAASDPLPAPCREPTLEAGEESDEVVEPGRAVLARGQSGELAAGFEPPAVPPTHARGRYMGLSLYFPAITSLGLVEAARAVFALPRSLRFGVRAVTLSVLFLTLLRKPTVESAKHLRRAEFGALTGTERAPCVKTLRRKLAELVSQHRSDEFGMRLARRWIETGVIDATNLYVDGHMKVYSGKRSLQQYYNSQRRVALPGLHSYFVGDQKGRPLLILDEELSANLANAMPEIVARIRGVLGKCRFTVIFDRGGFDHKLFKFLDAEGVGFITYQRGEPRLSEAAFSRQATRFEGKELRFKLAEDKAWVNGRGPWRRIVVRAASGHQTPILTNLAENVRAPRIVCLMTARWRQENLFKYMGEHFGLDQLISYSAAPAEPERLVPNPERRSLQRQIAALRQQVAVLKVSLGSAVLEKDRGRSIKGLKIAQRGAVGRLRSLEAQIDQLKAAEKDLPKTVTIAESGNGREVLRGEHKAVVDRIKITAYNAEEWLLERLQRHYLHPDDIRDLLRSFAELPGEIRTTRHGIVVTLAAPDTPAHARALQGLIADLNDHGATYPGTGLPVSYRIAHGRPRPAVHHAASAA